MDSFSEPAAWLNFNDKPPSEGFLEWEYPKMEGLGWKILLKLMI
jgi:hypothetical protein